MVDVSTAIVREQTQEKPPSTQGKTSCERRVRQLLELADVQIGGSRPWDLQIHRDRVFSRIVANGSLGLGEAYMDGDWDCQALDQLFDRIIVNRISERLGYTVPLLFLSFAARVQNRQTVRRAKTVARVHYDLPVDIFEATFDSRLTGSCAYWKSAATLDAAQEAKLDLICRKMDLRADDTVLDIGCGWGAFMGFAAERYGANCIGVTVSPQQVAYAKRRYPDSRIQPLLMDYRACSGQAASHIVSMGMFEHVGAKNHKRYFECARRNIQDGGLFLLHTIWENERYPAIDPWQNKYIFPNGDLPSVGEITTALEGLFVVEDVHNFGDYYDKTLMAWNEKFQSNRGEIARKHGDRFCRMWEYYLLQNAGAFRSRYISVGQFVLSPKGVRGGYQAIR